MSRVIPKVILESDIYKNLPNITQVLSARQLEYYTWVHLPSDIAPYYEVYQVDKFSNNEYILQDTTDFMTREDYQPWLRFLSRFLDDSAGQHIYRLSLINIATNDLHTLYFSYIMQTEQVDTPYVYMDHDQCVSCNL